MKVLDPGHDYILDELDRSELQKEFNTDQRLVFVKRCNPPEKYPGNTDAHSGTTIQEVCRCIIDRLKYVNKQIWCSEDDISIRHARGIILELEVRAAKRHGRRIFPMADIENEPTCKHCGHIQCNETCRPKVQDEAIAKAHSGAEG